MEKKHLLLGAHLSIAGGFENAIKAGQSIGCTAVQIFTHSNRQWEISSLSPQSVALFRRAWEQTPTIRSIISHGSYLINLGAYDQVTYQKSLHALRYELDHCRDLGITYHVVHPGARHEQSFDECFGRIADGINKVLDAVPDVTILLETMAGQGSVVCYQFEHLADIISRVEDKTRIGVCADTCHLFAAGYDIRSQDSYEEVWQQFDRIVGLERLKVFHLNDSLKGLGSRVDRHAHIGQGLLGLEAFSLLMNDDRFLALPKILETPKEDDLQDDVRNMATLRSLLTEATLKKMIAQ